MKKSRLGCLVVLLTLPGLAVAGSVTGKWHVVGDIAGTRNDSVCTLTQDGTKLTGSFKGEDSASDVTGTATDKEIRWTLKSNYNGTDLTITYVGALGDSETFTGTINIQPMGVQGTFKANKE
jgi:hypothetical protein